MSEKQVEELFRKDLDDLLCKWDATIEAEDHWQDYAECGRDIRITVYVPGIYDGNDVVREYVEINLGNYIKGSIDNE